MPKQLIILGPVLSFRGVSPSGNWQITALLGVAGDGAAPALVLEGKPCAAPLELLKVKRGTYYRYDLSCAMEADERKVKYGLADDSLHWNFTVPGKGYSPRMAYVSCNGFSDPTAIRKLVQPANAVWEDLLGNHDRNLRLPTFLLDKEQLWHESRTHDKGLQRFHLILMGGDQYFDSIWEEIDGVSSFSVQ